MLKVMLLKSAAPLNSTVTASTEIIGIGENEGAKIRLLPISDAWLNGYMAIWLNEQPYNHIAI
jgi:hypothetical protein